MYQELKICIMMVSLRFLGVSLGYQRVTLELQLDPFGYQKLLISIIGGVLGFLGVCFGFRDSLGFLGVKRPAAVK